MPRSPSEGYVSPYLTRPLRSLAEVLSERGAPAEIAIRTAALTPATANATFEPAGPQSALPGLPANERLFPAPANGPVRAALEARRAEIDARRAWLVTSGNVAAARALAQELIAIEAILSESRRADPREMAIAC